MHTECAEVVFFQSALVRWQGTPERGSNVMCLIVDAIGHRREIEREVCDKIQTRLRETPFATNPTSETHSTQGFNSQTTWLATRAMRAWCHWSVAEWTCKNENVDKQEDKSYNSNCFCCSLNVFLLYNICYFFFTIFCWFSNMRLYIIHILRH
jgi:hypothetical protein